MTAGMFFCSSMLVTLMNMVNQNIAKVQTMDPGVFLIIGHVRKVTDVSIVIGFAIAIASALLALVFGFMVSHRYNGPIVPLTRHLQELSQGKFSSRVRLRAGDELSELADAQNRLAEALEKRGTGDSGIRG